MIRTTSMIYTNYDTLIDTNNITYDFAFHNRKTTYDGEIAHVFPKLRSTSHAIPRFRGFFISHFSIVVIRYTYGTWPISGSMDLPSGKLT